MRKTKQQQETDGFRSAVARVLEYDNCSGCGACALISDRVTMALSDDGYMRPTVSQGTSSEAEARLFNSVCPGVTVDARGANAPNLHSSFGSYWSVWEAWASDPVVRYEGSSAGVTTAIVQEMITAGGIVVGAAASAKQPSRTVPVRLTTKEEALAAAGSRYAPVATAALAHGLGGEDALVGKPCEVAAMRALQSRKPSGEGPVLLSFFCAGTPSQFATDELSGRRLGVAPGDLASLRYRGRGWPGDFAVVSQDGDRRVLSYKESWGQVLGRTLQWRCKICPDGTGQLADVVVGDYWEADATGYPRFDATSSGRSVVICRTKRGHELLMQVVGSGAIEIRDMDISLLEPVQPFQVDRRETMAGRVIGTTAAGRPAPRFRGFGIVRNGVVHPFRNLRAGAGAFLRVLGRRG